MKKSREELKKELAEAIAKLEQYQNKCCKVSVSLVFDLYGEMMRQE